MVCKDFKSNHFEDLMMKLNKERKESSKKCDVIINAGSCNFSAHQCIIGGISSFLEKIFSTDMKEKYEKEASIKNVDPEIMEIILNFIYTCSITITSENVFSLLEAANYMQIPYLQNHCVEFLLGEIKLNNCLFLRSYAKKYELEELVAKANEIIQQEFEEVVEDEQFNQLILEDLSELLLLENKQVSSEEVMYHAVINWIHTNISTRHSHFNCLFDLVKLENLSGEFIRDVLMKETLVKESFECVEKINASLLSRVIASSSHETGILLQAKKDRGFLAVKHNQAFIYDLTKKQLSEIEKMKKDHFRGSVVKFNEEVYAVCGVDSKSVEKLKFNDSMRTWTEVSSTNEERYYNASAVCRDYIYCVGGKPPTSSGERYSFHDSKWNKLCKDMNTARYNHVLVAMKGKLYAFGGYGNDYLNSMESCDPSNDDGWKMLPPMKEKRYGFSGVVLEDKIYAIGGYNDSSYLSSVERFDPVLQTWTDVAPLNAARYFHASCVINKKIYVAGGNLTTVEVYDPTKNTWEIEAMFDDLYKICAIVAV